MDGSAAPSEVGYARDLEAIVVIFFLCCFFVPAYGGITPGHRTNDLDDVRGAWRMPVCVCGFDADDLVCRISAGGWS